MDTTGNTSSDSPRETDSNVPFPGQHSKESSQTNIDKEEQSLLQLSKIQPGDQKNIKQKITNAFVDTVKKDQAVSTRDTQILASEMANIIESPWTSLQMKCAGQSCPFINSCPIAKAQLALPIGEDCPVEKAAFKGWVEKHLQSLGIEDPNDPQYSFDMDTLYEIAAQEMIIWRCSAHLSDEPDLMTRQQVGATIQGDALYSDIVNPLLEILRTASISKSKLKQQLVATREAQVRAGRDAMDPSQKQAKLREDIQAIIAQRNAGRERGLNVNAPKEEIKEADYEIRDNEE